MNLIERLRNVLGVKAEYVDLVHEAADRIERLEAENAALRDALLTFDALIKHQYTGSREAMSDLTYAAQNAARVLGELE